MKRSSMFLLELLAMILVFSLCATVCVRILGTSWTISRESERLTEAVYLAEDAAAQLQSGNTEFLPELPAGYDLRAEEVSRSGGLVVHRVTITFEGESIYELDVTAAGAHYGMDMSDEEGVS